jgi:hypothetical protein
MIITYADVEKSIVTISRNRMTLSRIMWCSVNLVSSGVKGDAAEKEDMISKTASVAVISEH